MKKEKTEVTKGFSSCSNNSRSGGGRSRSNSSTIRIIIIVLVRNHLLFLFLNNNRRARNNCRNGFLALLFRGTSAGAAAHRDVQRINNSLLVGVIGLVREDVLLNAFDVVDAAERERVDAVLAVHGIVDDNDTLEFDHGSVELDRVRIALRVELSVDAVLAFAIFDGRFVQEIH